MESKHFGYALCMTHDARHKTPASVFDHVEHLLVDAGLPIAAKDENRPWGGFFVIDEAHAEAFIRRFFPGENTAELVEQKISPKMLIVAPGKRLSWQYHHRRSELWRVLEGEVLVAVSDTDEQQPPIAHSPGDIVRLASGQRHRLIGAKDWGIVAEIWRHTDPTHPSDEDDIVRVQDDFGRG
jgi:mannose-6-phosphate isomerase